jgi:peptide-methionine (S)-S-oxide reductase
MTRIYTLKSLALAFFIAVGFCAQVGKAKAGDLQMITVAGGCFWCVEADFERVNGVKEAVSGFIGGTVANPTYKQVVKGGTGHFEAVQITFDPDVVSLDRLYSMFFRSIDPTDAGGQFCDRGDSYRTAIFTSDLEQAETAKRAKAEAQAALGAPIVTPVLNATEFYPAEDYHQDYYKGTQLVLTRFGPKRQATAYKAYREACDRDARVRELWGDAAPFVGG